MRRNIKNKKTKKKKFYMVACAGTRGRPIEGSVTTDIER